METMLTGWSCRERTVSMKSRLLTCRVPLSFYLFRSFFFFKEDKESQVVQPFAHVSPMPDPPGTADMVPEERGPISIQMPTLPSLKRNEVG